MRPCLLNRTDDRVVKGRRWSASSIPAMVADDDEAVAYPYMGGESPESSLDEEEARIKKRKDRWGDRNTNRGYHPDWLADAEQRLRSKLADRHLEIQAAQERGWEVSSGGGITANGVEIAASPSSSRGSFPRLKSFRAPQSLW